MFIHGQLQYPATSARQHVFSSTENNGLAEPFCTAEQMNCSAGQRTRPKHVFALFCLLITYTHSYFSHTVSVCKERVLSKRHVCVRLFLCRNARLCVWN